ncbi:hypothetical protein NHH73_19085 [Oxalobacteraceae bacterium OTU3CINTB1]|nr:hypothetical protein NHH73_19085 [Oxalobacteraceae bacterium OTU3CINTB1]
MMFGRLDEWEPRARREGVRRYGFVLVSLAVHALLIQLLYYFGVYRVEMAQQRERESVSAAVARQSRIEKRVMDMEKIKDLLDQSRPGAPPRDGAGAVDEPDFRATSLPKPPEQLLAEARELSAAIAEVEKALKATELARIEKIPVQKARERLASPPADSAAPPPDATPPSRATPPPNGAPPPGATPGQLAAEIQELETKARAALAQRQQDLARQRDGVAVKRGQVGAVQANGTDSKPGTGIGGGGGDDAQGGEGRADATPGIGGNGIEQRIAAFIKRDAALPTGAARNYTGAGEAIFNPGGGNIPPVDARSMIKGAGRVLGRGGEFSNRVYINSWYVIGPFEGKHGRGLFSNHRYPPEQGVVLDAVYAGKENRQLKWRYVHAASYPLVPPDPDEDAVYYGYTEVMMDRDQELTMWIGADDDAQIWLNDVQVWAGGNINKQAFWPALYDVPNTHGRDYNMTEAKRTVRFRKGRNKIFFKMANGPTRLFFSLVLTK